MGESASQTSEGVLQKSIHSGKWLGIDYALQKILGFVTFLILAKYLAPSDFGVISIVLLVPNFILSTTETGLGTAALLKEGDPRRFLNPLWTLNILRGIGIAIGVFIFGPLIGRFFHIEHLTWLIQLSGLLIIIRQFSNVGELYIWKELDLKKIFIRNFSKTFGYSIIVVIMAILLRSYYALFIGTAALYLTETISTYFLHPYRPKLSFNFKPLKQLTKHGKWFYGQNLIEQIYAVIENSVIARLLNTASLGLYSKAKNIASIGPGSVTSIITLVSLPAYAKIKDSDEKVRDGFLKSLDLFFFMVIPVAIVTFAAGGKIILMILGKDWLPMAGALKIFVIYFILSGVIHMTHKLLSGIGYPDKKVKMDIIKTVLTVGLMFILTPLYGINGTAFALTVGLIPIFIFYMYFLITLTLIKLRDIVWQISAPLLLSLSFLIPTLFLKDILIQLSTPLTLVFFALTGVLYLATIYFMGKKYKVGPYLTLELVFRTIRNR